MIEGPVRDRTWNTSLIALLVLIAAGIAWLILQIPANVARGPAVCLLAIGGSNILLHRRIGRQTFQWTRSGPAFVSKFWNGVGATGTQHLYLGIGVILVSAGLALLIK